MHELQTDLGHFQSRLISQRSPVLACLADFVQQPFSDASGGTRDQRIAVGCIQIHPSEFVHIIMRLSLFHPTSPLARVSAVLRYDHFLVMPSQGCRRWLAVESSIGWNHNLILSCWRDYIYLVLLRILNFFFRQAQAATAICRCAFIVTQPCPQNARPQRG